MPPLCFRTIDIAYCTVHFLFKMKLINYLMSLTKTNQMSKRAKAHKIKQQILL